MFYERNAFIAYLLIVRPVVEHQKVETIWPMKTMPIEMPDLTTYFASIFGCHRVQLSKLYFAGTSRASIHALACCISIIMSLFRLSKFTGCLTAPRESRQR